MGRVGRVLLGPAPSTDRGLSLTLRQSWGASPGGGADALLSRETLAGLAANSSAAGFDVASRLEGELGCGLPMFGGGFTGTPNLSFGRGDSARDWRIGWRLTSALRGNPGFEVNLDATRDRQPQRAGRAWGDAAHRGAADHPVRRVSRRLPRRQRANPRGCRCQRAVCRQCRSPPLDGAVELAYYGSSTFAMHKDAVIALPPPKGRKHRPRPIAFGSDTEPPLFPAPTILDEVRPLQMRTVVRETREGRLWNEFFARYHYLGYKTLVGAQVRYAVHDRNGWPLAMLGFSIAAWKLAPRDHFIGWTPQLREKKLLLVVDSPRVLILPWIEIPNLGSHILALVRRRLPIDWIERYNTTPVLIETFDETPRYTGAVSRASGRLHVGTTQGRGRYDRDKFYDKPR